MPTATEQAPLPPTSLLLLESSRSLLELCLLAPALPLLASAPHGDGHPVLVLPGLGAGDFTTLVLRQFLRQRGYAAEGWRLGLNTGSLRLQRPLRQRLAQMRERHGRRVSLVGWSLGGVFARELAKHRPDDVRSVITLGSPFRGPGTASNVQWVYECLSGQKAADTARLGLEQTPPVPTTAIFTRSDGIVPWQRCREAAGRPQVESIEVRGSHCGLGHNASVLYVLADRLAQPEAGWKPFVRSEALQALYPEPWR